MVVVVCIVCEAMERVSKAAAVVVRACVRAWSCAFRLRQQRGVVAAWSSLWCVVVRMRW